MMIKKIMNEAAFRLYSAGWSLAIPLLKKNRRIAEGFRQRTLKDGTICKTDIWIQAASAGEAYLAVSLLKHLHFEKPASVLVTSNTTQGIEILEKGLTETAACLDVTVSYAPFDHPAIIRRAVSIANPSVMVLLELEMWPGLLKALRQHRCKTLIINGRLTPKSLKGYLAWPSIWQAVAPDSILAVSGDDAERFRKLFPETETGIMNNIKFDSTACDPAANNSVKPELMAMKKEGCKVVLFGSVRKEEEEAAGKMIASLLAADPGIRIWIFPRHMERTGFWEDFFTGKKISWQLRTDSPGKDSDVVLWDCFGELTEAYSMADAAFVGGSLAPLGGQNFLEVLAAGLRPVIGPSWENFFWTGQEIVNQGLLIIADNWESAVAELQKQLGESLNREAVRNRFSEYLRARQGGTLVACRKIEESFHENI